MMKFHLIVLLIFPIVLMAQKRNVIELSLKHAQTSVSANGWIPLDSGWKFQPGDNPEWARPGNEDVT
jgi:two-component system, NtrC family, sensor kinase